MGREPPADHGRAHRRSPAPGRPPGWPWRIADAARPGAAAGPEPRATELLFGDRKRPCPAPMSARRHVRSPTLKPSGRVVRLSRPNARTGDFAALAGTRWPMRSESVPLNGATTALAIGIGVRSSPACRGVAGALLEQEGQQEGRREKAGEGDEHGGQTRREGADAEQPEIHHRVRSPALHGHERGAQRDADRQVARGSAGSSSPTARPG